MSTDSFKPWHSLVHCLFFLPLPRTVPDATYNQFPNQWRLNTSDSLERIVQKGVTEALHSLCVQSIIECSRNPLVVSQTRPESVVQTGGGHNSPSLGRQAVMIGAAFVVDHTPAASRGRPGCSSDLGSVNWLSVGFTFFQREHYRMTEQFFVHCRLMMSHQLNKKSSLLKATIFVFNKVNTFQVKFLSLRLLIHCVLSKQIHFAEVIRVRQPFPLSCSCCFIASPINDSVSTSIMSWWKFSNFFIKHFSRSFSWKRFGWGYREKWQLLALIETVCS